MKLLSLPLPQGLLPLAVALAGGSPLLLAAPIPGLFNTGFDAGGQRIEGSDVADARYALIESVDDRAPGPDAVTLNPGFPVGPWLEETPESRWIAPQADQGSGNAPGVYIFRTTVDLSSFNPETVRITGRWASDNGGMDILVNGESTGIASPSFTEWTEFEISQGFVSGTNTLDFVVENAGDADNPTGVRIELQGEGEFEAVSKIPDLFGTGYGSDGTLLGPSGETDGHYILAESSDPDFPGPDAVTLNPGFPVGPWLAEGADSEFPHSRWIAPRAAQDQGSSPGEYRYQTTFNLDGFDLSTVTIVGRWATDDGSLGIFLNEEELFFNSNGFVDWADFEITEGFVPGENVLEFGVSNGGEANNPTGLRVDIVSATGERTAGAPPTIVTQPQPRTAIEGDDVILSVTAGGSPPLSYQWQRNGEDVANGTSRTLTLESIASEAAGDYAVTVSNGAGEASTEPVAVTVLGPIPGLFDTGVDENGDALDDLSEDPHYQLVENADGPDNTTFVHDSQVFPIVDGPWLANSATSKWIAPREDTAEAAGGDYVYRLTFDLTGLDPATAFLRGRWATDNEGVSLRLNGADTGLTNAAQFGSLTSFTLEEAPFISGENTLDFVVNNAGIGPTALRVDGLSGGALPSTGEATPPSFVVAPPVMVEAFAGESFTLRALADGTPPLSYSWTLNGQEIGTAPDLALTDIQPNQAGDYTVAISNAQGTITSDPVNVVILEPIPDLFNTGLDAQGQVLDDLVPDPHYALIANPTDDALEARVLNSTIFPIVAGPWVPNGADAKWIGVQDDNGGEPGDYVYRLTFDLSAFNPEEVFIEGDWAGDDRGDPPLLNGQDTGIRDTSNFTSLRRFRLESGFVPGMNTLDFPVSNGGDAANPTGLIVANLRGGGPTEDPNLIGPSVSPFGLLNLPEAVTVPVTLRNSGRSETLLITQAQLTGDDAALFTLGSVPDQLAPNESVVVEITVDPQGVTGNFAAALELTTNDPSTPVQSFDLSAFIPISPNLVARYKLDETEGDRVIDASGFGRDAAYNADQGTLTLGQEALAPGTSVRFEGGAYAEVGAEVLPPFEGPFTIALWYRPGPTDGAASLISRGDGQGDPFALIAAGPTLFWFSAGGDPAISLESDLILDAWYHLAITQEDGVASLFVNGSLAASAPTENFTDRSANVLQFGAANGILGINGSLDDIQIYNVALDADTLGGMYDNPGTLAGEGGGDPLPQPDPRTIDLSIQTRAEGLTLSWPEVLGATGLETSLDLRAWTPVDSEPQLDGEHYHLEIASDREAYFRFAP